MRLLKFGGRGDLSLTDDLLRNPFAYLGADGDEVTFKDLENQSYKSRGPKMGLSTTEWRGAHLRPGLSRSFEPGHMTGVAGAAAVRCIRELGNVYTCCTDKTSGAELSEAINLMCRWYPESGSAMCKELSAAAYGQGLARANVKAFLPVSTRLN